MPTGVVSYSKRSAIEGSFVVFSFSLLGIAYIFSALKRESILGVAGKSCNSLDLEEDTCGLS